MLAPEAWWATVRSFIVHGHDHDTRDALVRFLTGALRLPPPRILGNLATGGMTLIEKLEQVGGAVDLVFVLMTPVDLVTTGPGPAVPRARPNVWLEAGYFIGSLTRRSGRVILLTCGGAYVPSDLLGVGAIDVSGGIESAGDAIRREIEAFAIG